MILGRVIGEIHGSIKHRFYEGRKLLWIEKTTPTGAPTGDYVIAVDSVGAGADERVLVLDEGNGARQVLDSTDGPVRSVVVGIIDDIVDG
ncbi:MAG TPA: EutN/CcmL family microcompartment protein [Thermoanaerobaculia bacterium]|jgi:ethanolamine utilization protein EutN|nr:EutN/CcmL family microcompartment protein [Thermoanaerobaculia bacterium]